MNEQLPRRALVWLLAGLLCALAPHALRLPPWSLVVIATALFWRYRVHCGQWSLPWWPVKGVLVLMAFAAVSLHFRTLRGLEPAVALLALAAGLKCMELRSARDVLALVLTDYFLIASALLFEQGIPHALYAAGATVIATAALVARYQRVADTRFPSPLRVATLLLAQALPLMVVLFLVFPRLAPLWAVPSNPAAAKTGPGDTMSPGDISHLGASSEPAFRATFTGATPPHRELYWRGQVFSEFDGRTWRQGSWARAEGDLAAQGARKPAFMPPRHAGGGAVVDYEIILEPSNQRWAYVVGFPLDYDNSLRLGSDFRLMTARPVSQRFRYRVRADLGMTLEPQLGALRRRVELALPDGFNPRTRDRAQAWRSAATSDQAYIDRVLDTFRTEPFVYTLRPPLLGRDAVDEFLFGTRRGFCEHYASAFVVLMRAAGIPARVVAGYLGGERSPVGDYVLVHQFDAHAWAEVWIAGRGWVRVDPTAAVSPLRVESGLEAAVGVEFLADSPLAAARYANVPLVAWVRMRWDLLNYQWARVVLRYDTANQFVLLDRLLGHVDMMRLLALILAVGGCVLGIAALALFGMPRRHARDGLVAAWLAACERLGHQGLARRRGEAPLDFAARVATARGDAAVEFTALTRAFVDCVFAAEAGHRGDQRRLQRALHACRVRRPG